MYAVRYCRPLLNLLRERLSFPTRRTGKLMTIFKDFYSNYDVDRYDVKNELKTLIRP